MLQVEPFVVLDKSKLVLREEAMVRLRGALDLISPRGLQGDGWVGDESHLNQMAKFTAHTPTLFL